MKTIFRCIAPTWLVEEDPSTVKVIEGQFSDNEIVTLNNLNYNIYYFPNYPKNYDLNKNVVGSDVDTFKYVFVDMDLKDKTYNSPEDFVKFVLSSGNPPPSKIVHSGHGIHVYWEISDLTAMDYLRFQRRLIKRYKTDEAVGQICQLMRYPGTINHKIKESPIECQIIDGPSAKYTCEELDSYLDPISPEDEDYCKTHYNRTYNIQEVKASILMDVPQKFLHLIKGNKEVQTLWATQVEDRSKADYRLAHIMYAHGFSKEEATCVLTNTSKSITRSPQHRLSYATNIVDKIWIAVETNNTMNLSRSVADILQKGIDTPQGIRFPCWPYLDNTEYGFRLGQVIGLVAGSGVGKTSVALNMFLGFVQNNPEYDHFFIPLEQPDYEIAARWQILCGDKVHLYNKVHVINNYDEKGTFRNLSFDDIRSYLLQFQQSTGRKIGCVVIDHIGALKKKDRDGENQDLMGICHAMKSFALETNTMLVMQSQASREKAGIGDLELNKDAAYGTVYFESYCDYLITIHQPLKRCYKDGAPTVTAYKFCKIRHKKQGYDTIQEDVCYKLMFDPASQLLRELTDDEEKAFDYFLKQATNKRKEDRKTDLVKYTSIRWDNGKSKHN